MDLVQDQLMRSIGACAGLVVKVIIQISVKITYKNTEWAKRWHLWANAPVGTMRTFLLVSIIRRSTSFAQYTEKKDLIESKKIICLNDFLWFKEMICLNEIKFVWFKQNIFEPNKYLFESNFYLKSNKLYL